MRTLLMMAIVATALTACTTEIRRIATNEGVTSSSAPAAQYSFRGFELQTPPSDLQHKIGSATSKSFLWKELQGTRTIEISFITLAHGSTYQSKPVAELAPVCLCAGTAQIGTDEYRTQIRVHSSNKTLFKSYLSRVGPANYVKLFYHEELSTQRAQEYLLWQAEKRIFWKKKVT